MNDYMQQIKFLRIFLCPSLQTKSPLNWPQAEFTTQRNQNTSRTFYIERVEQEMSDARTGPRQIRSSCRARRIGCRANFHRALGRNCHGSANRSLTNSRNLPASLDLRHNFGVYHQNKSRRSCDRRLLSKRDTYRSEKLGCLFGGLGLATRTLRHRSSCSGAISLGLATFRT